MCSSSSSSRCFECAAECVDPTPSAADDGPNPPPARPATVLVAATAPWRTAMAMGLLSGGRAAQYSIELLAQWDRKRRPIPLAGDKPAKHFGKVVLIHLLEASVSEQSNSLFD